MQLKKNYDIGSRLAHTCICDSNFSASFTCLFDLFQLRSYALFKPSSFIFTTKKLFLLLGAEPGAAIMQCDQMALLFVQ